MTDSQNEQDRLFDGVECELQRLKENGLTPRLFAYNPAPDAPFREFNLAIAVSDHHDSSGCMEIIRIGSYCPCTGGSGTPESDIPRRIIRL